MGENIANLWIPQLAVDPSHEPPTQQTSQATYPAQCTQLATRLSTSQQLQQVRAILIIPHPHTTPAQSALQNWTSFPLYQGPAPLSTPHPHNNTTPAPLNTPHHHNNTTPKPAHPLTTQFPSPIHFPTIKTPNTYTHTQLHNTTLSSITQHLIRISFYRTENHMQWNAVWPPDDGRKKPETCLGTTDYQ
jgi:hypothetical protein